MSEHPNDEFLFSCPQCGFQQPVPVAKKGAAIVCKNCKSTVFVPSEKRGDEDVEEEYGLSAAWEPPKRTVPIYSADGEASYSAPGEEEDTVREPEGVSGYEDREEEEEEEEEGYHRPELPVHPMWTGVLRFLLTKEAIVLLIGLTVTAEIVFSLAIGGLVFGSVGTTGEGSVEWSGYFLAGLALGTLGLLWAIWAFVCGLTIVQETAAGFDRIDGLPEPSWWDWVQDALFIFAPLAASAALGYAAANLLPLGALFWITVVVFVLFPLFFLSALDEQFWVGFVSIRVYRSLATARRAWAALYGYQFVLLGMLAAAGAVAWALHKAMIGSPSWIVGADILALCFAGLGVAAMLVYARALGRLVWVISQTEKTLQRQAEADDESEEE